MMHPGTLIFAGSMTAGAAAAAAARLTENGGAADGTVLLHGMAGILRGTFAEAAGWLILAAVHAAGTAIRRRCETRTGMEKSERTDREGERT